MKLLATLSSNWSPFWRPDPFTRKGVALATQHARKLRAFLQRDSRISLKRPIVSQLDWHRFMLGASRSRGCRKPWWGSRVGEGPHVSVAGRVVLQPAPPPPPPSGWRSSDGKLMLTIVVLNNFFPRLDRPCGTSAELGRCGFRNCYNERGAPRRNMNWRSSPSTGEKRFLSHPVPHKPRFGIFVTTRLATYMLSAIVQQVTGETGARTISRRGC